MEGVRGWGWGGEGILYVLLVTSLYRNVSVLLIVCLFFHVSPFSSGSWMEEGQVTWQGQQTNKQTEGIKIEKNRADEMWQRVFTAVRLMASSSHYSPVCPLPPIGCNNIVWQGVLPVSRHLPLLLHCVEDKEHFTPGSAS